jgi:hypothetical protein
MEGITRGTAGTDVHARSEMLERLAAQARAMLPTLEKWQARTALGLFRMLAEGEAVSHERLAERLTLPVDDVSATLAAFPAVFHDRKGRIVAFWGLGLGKTGHRVEVEGRTVYAWCFPDTLYFPRVLGKSVSGSKIGFGHAALGWYSWMRPFRRSRRRIFFPGIVSGSNAGSGG